ncbi:Splicing factor U2AF 50 kDa subunit [Smittium mucronatum]|uniref:Splicing factor U2AF 50 kDa subunit n=1 Tax=Smittium mucronatum TaxID=133383 RepID=A0A1R0H440_9FUNG|nr:Splicing factor U2AF 50 kDa subunit [Smittium mucronatum]
MDIHSISDLRVVDLKKELQSRNLSPTGNKADLVNRLTLAIESESKTRQSPIQITPTQTPNMELNNSEPPEVVSSQIEPVQNLINNEHPENSISQNDGLNSHGVPLSGIQNEDSKINLCDSSVSESFHKTNQRSTPETSNLVEENYSRNSSTMEHSSNNHNKVIQNGSSLQDFSKEPVDDHSEKINPSGILYNNSIADVQDDLNANFLNPQNDIISSTNINHETNDIKSGVKISPQNDSFDQEGGLTSLEKERILRLKLEQSRKEISSSKSKDPDNKRPSEYDQDASESKKSRSERYSERSGYRGSGRDKELSISSRREYTNRSRSGDRDFERGSRRSRDRTIDPSIYKSDFENSQDFGKSNSINSSENTFQAIGIDKQDSLSRDDGRSTRHKSRSRSPSESRRRHSKRDGDSRPSDVIPLHLRERKLNMWDLAPPGFESMTAKEAKEAGLFPPPGQALGSRNVASFNPAVLMEQKMRDDASKDGREMDMRSSLLLRQMRRLYVGNIPYGCVEDSIAAFFNKTMIDQGFAPESEYPVVAVQINHAKNYAFVEFRTNEQATLGMSLDGVQFQAQNLKIRRPKDYIPPTGQPPDPAPLTGYSSNDGINGHSRNNSYGIPSMVSESPFKIYIGNIPTYLTDDQVIELLLTFGQLKAFILIKDNMTGMSKGFAFCEYVDSSVTDIVCTGLNNMELGDRRIIVQRASVGSRTNQLSTQMMGMQNGTMPVGISGGFLPPVLTGDSVQPTPILQLLNMVDNDELVDDAEYNDILDDVRDECGKFGVVVDLKIPRPVEGMQVNGVGKIFVKFQNISEATTALRSLAGRKFADRTVIVSYLSEEDFLSENF